MNNTLFTDKQAEYLRHAHRRWNIKTGAVRSGKTFTDFYLIPKRIRDCTGGLIVFTGNTRFSLERNIFEPMRKIWGDGLVGRINGDGGIRMFGIDCFTIGASYANAAEKLQGCSVGYCYGDEITTWNEEVFRMLQSRLDRPDSVFDGTCNPASPDHWLRSFLLSDADIYCQHYTIDDNPRLDRAYVDSLKKAYFGTVYYDRYILGKWTAAEGIIYRSYADDPSSYRCPAPDGESLAGIVCGLDFGGNRSKTAMVCCGIKYVRREDGTYLPDVTAICSERHDVFSPAELTARLCDFCRKVKSLCGRLPDSIYCDSAEVMLIRGLRRELMLDDELCSVSLRPALKTKITDRITKTLSLLSDRRLHLTEHCASLSHALCTAVWEDSPGGRADIRRDDFTTDIDSLDAFEYSIERLRI